MTGLLRAKYLAKGKCEVQMVCKSIGQIGKLLPQSPRILKIQPFAEFLFQQLAILSVLLFASAQRAMPFFT